MTRDLRTLIYLLNFKLREECSRTLGPGHGLESSKRNRGAAVEADVIGRAAVEADAISGSSSTSCNRGVAARPSGRDREPRS